MDPTGTDRGDDLPELFQRFVDQRIDAAGLKRLEDRLRSDAEAREYCAERLRFEADLTDALDTRSLEWHETRRVIFGPTGSAPSWEIQRNQSLRYGEIPKRISHVPPRRFRLRSGWIVSTVTLLAIAAGIPIWLALRPPAEPVLALRNGDFEATDLSLNAAGMTAAIIDWQDFFQTEKASLQEVGRTSGGTIFAPSGRNVVRLGTISYLTQRLRFSDGRPLSAQPGLRVAIRGKAYAKGGAPHLLRAALRVVASAHPDMLQYEGASDSVDIAEGGWQPFRLVLDLTDDLTRLPSDLEPKRPSGPRFDLTGRELTLSIDSRGAPSSALLIDDLHIELLP